MSQYQTVNKERHLALRWQRFTDYHFAAGDSIVSLAASEVIAAGASMPLGFVRRGESYRLVALQGLIGDKNLYVGPQGYWLDGCYVPGRYRTYPFALAQREDGSKVLCVDEEGGLSRSVAGGEAFFDAQGEISPAVRNIVAFLRELDEGYAAADRLVAALYSFDLIEPWPLMVQSPRGEHCVEGLFRISETALNVVSADALVQLRNQGALALAYCQMLSMQQLQRLRLLIEAHAVVEVPPQSETLNLEFLNRSETISFGSP